MSGTLRQLAALLALRWQMLRSPGPRVALVVCAVLVAWLLRLSVTSSGLLDPAVLAATVQVAPGAFLGFGALALVAPLTAGGGHSVVPPDQLVAYPVRPSTHFLAGLLLAPVNLVWVVQLLVLAAMTSWLSVEGGPALPAVTTSAYVVALTAGGQALAWLVVGARLTRAGRRIVAAGWVLLGLAGVVMLRLGLAARVLLHGPTLPVVRALEAGAVHDVGGWLPVTAALLVVAGVSLPLGARACAWALRRPGDAHVLRHTAPVPRRGPRATVLRELVAVDRAGAWRAPALRRGALVLAVLPALVAITFPVPWESLIVLPGLVAAGAGLLFGVNAFALDGGGALWLASLPVDPRLRLASKVLVTAETVLGAVAVAGLAAAARSPGTPTAAEVVAIVTSALTCAAVVVAVSVSSSVRRPHHAPLAGPRDAIAPPGALVAASARLSLPAAAVAALLAASARSGRAWAPLLVASPALLLAALLVLRAARRWRDPVVRARVAQTVARG